MQTSEKPLVSVLMTAYNREKFIAAAIESVLASSYTSFELIVVDDGSSDSTVSIAKDYARRDERIRVHINEKNLGDYPNRNRAATHATGKYLKYLDSDDLIYEHGLEVFVRCMEQHPEAAIGICYRKNITHQPFPWVMSPEESLRHHFFNEGFLDCAPTGTIIRRDRFGEVGGFSGKRMVGDLELGLKMAVRNKVMLLPPALTFWRNHGDQEVFIGLDGDMYITMTRGVLEEQFESMPESVLTKKEQSLILKKLNRSNKVERGKKVIKRIFFPRNK